MTTPYVMGDNGFQLLTSGLFSGDKVVLRFNYTMENNSFWCYLPWVILIEAELDGLKSPCKDAPFGPIATRNNVEMPFTGNMPSGKDLRGKVVFKAAMPYAPFTVPWKLFTVVEEFPITVPNLDDILPEEPDGVPPAVCTEGQDRCQGFDLYVCQNNQWKVKEYNSPECGYTPEPICTNGDDRCVGTDYQVCVGDHWEIRERNSSRCGYVPPDGGEPTPPTDEGIGGWFDRNKTLIIIVSAAVLVISIIVLATKTRVQFPVAAWPKFQPPIVRK